MQVSTSIPYAARAMTGYINSYNKEIGKSLERLGSGLRINKPSDDSFNYFKAQKLNRRADNSLATSRALEDHVSRLNTASDALDSARSMLLDMEALALQASEEDNASIRADLAQEFEAKKDGYTSLINSTTYDGGILMSGSYDTDAGADGFTAQVDEDANNTYNYGVLDARYDSADGLNMQTGDAEDLVTGWENGGKAAALTFYNEFNSLAADGVTPLESGISKIERNANRIETHLTVIQGARDNLVARGANYEAAASSIVGVDEVEEATKFSALQIKQQASASFLAQFNVGQSNVISALMTTQNS
ncbi:MAG: flagellin [Fibrobacterales bacterium]